MGRGTRAAVAIRRTTLTVLAVAGVLTMLVSCDAVRQPQRETPVPTTPTRSAATTAAPDGADVAVGSSAHGITVDGRNRTFRLYRPATLSSSAAVPLVVMLHGALGSARQAETAYGWNSMADRHGFVVAYPNGFDRSWAVSTGCCGPPARDGVDDVAFISAAVAAISDRLPIDPDRIYAAGISNGGMLAYRLACDTTTFAAIGVVAGKQLGPCPSPTPTSVIHIHGTADDLVPYDGGQGKVDDRFGVFPTTIDGGPVPDQIATWREISRCAAPEVRTVGTVTTSTASCPAGRDVELITIDGAGHQWPGSRQSAAERLLGLDPPATELDATESAWRFFSTHRREG